MPGRSPDNLCGSIIAVADGAGATLAINSYDGVADVAQPQYGIPGPSNQGRFQYTGQAYLPDFGLYHYKARTYSPTLGRFLQTDPIGYGDGMNMYDYVGGDPVNGVDPSGMAVEVPNRTILRVQSLLRQVWARQSRKSGRFQSSSRSQGSLLLRVPQNSPTFSMLPLLSLV